MGKTNSSLVDTWLDDDHLMLLECWARDGVYMHEICERIGISSKTFANWRATYPEINEAINTGKEIVDYKVENALLKAALGYTTKEIKVTVGKQVKNGQSFEIMKETTIKEIAPNVTACMAWLNNRLPDKWKRNRDNIITDEEFEDNDLHITIVRGPQNKDDDTKSNVNKEIQLSKNNSKEDNLMNQNDIEDKNYWPDDWEDD